MHLILAPDSFKGSLTALEAALAMRTSALRVLGNKSTFRLACNTIDSYNAMRHA